MDWCAWCAISGISVALWSGMGMGNSSGLYSTTWRPWRRGLAWPCNSSSRHRKWSLIGANFGSRTNKTQKPHCGGPYFRIDRVDRQGWEFTKELLLNPARLFEAWRED